MFFVAGHQNVALPLSSPMCWDKTGRRSSLDDLISSWEGNEEAAVRSVYDEPPATTNAGGAVSVNKCSPAVLHANRLQVLGRAGMARGSNAMFIPRSCSRRGRRSLANVERLRKDVQLLEFWAVAVDPG